MEYLAAAFASCGLRQGQTVAQFADNSSRWVLADQGIMLNGAINAVRGGATQAAQLLDILNVSGASAIVVQDAAVLGQLTAVLQQAEQRPAFVVALWGDVEQSAELKELGIQVFSYSSVLPSTAALLGAAVCATQGSSLSQVRSLSTTTKCSL